MDDIERAAKLKDLAETVLSQARNEIAVSLRFMDTAVFRLTPSARPGPPATDGQILYYDPEDILRRYKKEPDSAARLVLHMLLHCVFRHGFIGLVDEALWDLAADIATESIICDLGRPAFAVRSEGARRAVIGALRAKVHPLTAEKLYAHFQKYAPDPAWAGLFREDDHGLWHHREQSAGEAQPAGVPEQSGLSPEQLWRDISEHIRMDLEAFTRAQGEGAGNLMAQLDAVNRERYDYTAFLKKFAVSGEAMKINDDEFDYVYYTYGLKLYGRVPLIEPLEYKEVKRVREFVIAIDTSGSTGGDLVRRFLQKTYNILMSTESFFDKVNLHILQCDAAIQHHAKITCRREMEDYIRDLKVYGMGGTDFRPVFRCVDEMIRQREFAHLKGLIYFTDGMGTYPKRKPDYQTAFVFIRDEYTDMEVPPWAIKLILEKEEI